MKQNAALRKQLAAASCSSPMAEMACTRQYSCTPLVGAAACSSKSTQQQPPQHSQPARPLTQRLPLPALCLLLQLQVLPDLVEDRCERHSLNVLQLCSTPPPPHVPCSLIEKVRPSSSTSPSYFFKKIKFLYICSSRLGKSSK